MPILSHSFSHLRRYTELFGSAYGTEDFSLFLYALAKMERPTRALELGTGFGISALWLALAFAENGSGHIWSIDDGSHFAAAKIDALAQETSEKVLPLQLPSDQDLSYHKFLNALAEALGVAERVTFVPAHLDSRSLLTTLESCPGLLEKPLNLVFTDYASSAPGLYDFVADIVPLMADRGSMFVDAVSTRFETFLALERLVHQLNSRHVPRSIAERLGPERSNSLADVLTSHELRLTHLVEQKKRPQNSTAWLRLEPIDLIPFDLDLISW